MIRYKYIDQRIVDFLRFVSEQTGERITYPLDIVRMIRLLPNVRLWSYQYYAKTFNYSIEQVIQQCASECGCIVADPSTKTFLILFDKSLNEGRVRWTLAHELGHYILHQAELTRNAQHEDIEKEADYFASTLLAPYPLYKVNQVNSYVDVLSAFGLSNEAAFFNFRKYQKFGCELHTSKFCSEIRRICTLKQPDIIEDAFAHLKPLIC